MPSEHAEPVAPSCCGTVRDLTVHYLRTGAIDPDAGTALLLALGYEPVEVEDLVHTAREAALMARNYRKERGRATEHLVAAAFAGDGWPHAEATGAGSPGRDIKGVPGVAVEVKARARFEPMANLRQAITNAAGDVAAVVMRPTGGGPSNIDEWPAFLTFGQLRSLLHQAGYGTPPGSPLSGSDSPPVLPDGSTAQNGPEDVCGLTGQLPPRTCSCGNRLGCPYVGSEESA